MGILVTHNETKELVPFQFNHRTINVIKDKAGNPWFVAKELCKVFGLVDRKTSLRLLDDDEKGVHTMPTLGGPQKMVIINEPGLYSLILRSRKPAVKAFKRWGTHEVLSLDQKRSVY